MWQPSSEKELLECVQTALHQNQTLALEGQASKKTLSKHRATDQTLSLSQLSGIKFYEPNELVISAYAGTPLEEIIQLLESKGQTLAFEPISSLACSAKSDQKDQGTLGGMVATNISGSRRVITGSCRDHILGVTFVNGKGKLIQSGGRVMKNVAGYDLTRLLTGSMGTLGIMSQVTLKTRPLDESSTTIYIENLPLEEAIMFMAKALKSPFEVSGAAYIPKEKHEDKSSLLLRLEGFENSIKRRTQKLIQRLKDDSNKSIETQILSHIESREIWKKVSNARFFETKTYPHLWRVLIQPHQTCSFMKRLQEQCPDHDYCLDWGGGLIWLGLKSADETSIKHVQKWAQRFKASTQLIRTTKERRKKIAFFSSQSNELIDLNKRIKNAFDPHSLFNSFLYHDHF